MSEWNSVADQLPHDYEWVLVCEVRQGTGEPSPITLARYEKDHWVGLAEEEAVYSDLWWDIDLKKITHWRGLPESPLLAIC